MMCRWNWIFELLYN